MDAIAQAISKCPFLHLMAEKEGEAFARRLAVNPFCPSSSPLVFPEESSASSVDFVARVFHGKGSAIPLPQFTEARTPVDSLRLPAQPSAFQGVPVAAISLAGGLGGFLPDPRNFIRKNLQKSKNSKRNSKPKRNKNSNASKNASSASEQLQSSSGKCPMRRVLGGLMPLAVASAGRMECPAAIVQMRAAVAALKPVKLLRPQALPLRSLALAMVSAGFNIPCGVWREHTQKFSPQWFFAVHATIPFVAMLRKAVLMPKWAIALTIASAIVGQQAGAKIEKERIAWKQGASSYSTGNSCRRSCSTMVEAHSNTRAAYITSL